MGSTKAGTTLQIVPAIVICPDTVGLVISTVHVIVLEVVAVLPQPSLAVNVLVCERLHPLVLIVPSILVTIVVPQTSVAVAEPRAAFISDVDGLQPGNGVCVTLIVGGVTSTVRVSCWVTVAVLPQASVTLYVRNLVSKQPVKLGAPSLTNVTVGVLQLSASSVTTVGSGAGKVPLHPGRFIVAGLLAVGARLSVTVMT